MRSYGVLDTLPEQEYDALTELTAMSLSAPVAVITLVDADRLWYKSQHGITLTTAARKNSFCDHAVATASPLVVPDTTKDVRFAGSVLVTGPPAFRAFAGIPLIGRDGLPVGVLGVFDHEPRTFSPAQLKALATLAHQVITLMEIRRLDHMTGRPVGSDTTELSHPLRLRAALDAGEFVAHFQPIIDLTSDEPTGFEALLRWEHPEHGLILPGRFLPAIESSGLIMPVGRHILREAITMLARLHVDPANRALGMAVNLSLSQLAQPGLSSNVLHEIAVHRVQAQWLSLEITEAAALLDDREAVAELHILHTAGVNLSIDDYGTGYSSLMRLLDLPIRTLKIDRSLTKRLPSDRRALAVARSTIDMAADLGIAVVAEGIELLEQKSVLRDLNCRYGQGFLFSRAVAPELLWLVIAELRERARPKIQIDWYQRTPNQHDVAVPGSTR